MLFSIGQATVIVLIIFIIILLLLWRIRGKKYIKRPESNINQAVVSLFHRMDAPAIQPITDPNTTLATIRTNAINSLRNIDANLNGVSNDRFILMDMKFSAIYR